MNTQSLDVTKIKVHPRFTEEQAKYWLLIREAILFEGGKNYDQTVWTAYESECGTACCISGHASLVIFGKPFFDVPSNAICPKLGLSLEEDSVVTDADGNEWKSPFNAQFREAPNQQAEAIVAGNYILSILETGEV